MRPLILGMNDPSGSGTALGYDDGGSAGARLLSLSGLSAEEYEAAFERTNLLPGRVWRPKAARLAGERLLVSLPSDRVVVVLGAQTWAALGLPKTDMCGRVGNFFFLPHPSGRNLTYNSRTRRREARRLLMEIACASGQDTRSRSASVTSRRSRTG